MKIYRNTFLICVAVMAVALIMLIFAPDHKLKDLIKDILVGVFASTLVSAIITLTQYFHEKDKLLTGIYEKLNSFYYNMIVISRMTGNLYPVRYKEIKELNQELKNINGFIELLPNHESISISNYYGFYQIFQRKRKGFRMVLDSIKSFQYTKSCVSRNFSKIISMGQQYEIFLLKTESDKIKGEDREISVEMRGFEDAILSLVSKNHEYQTSLTFKVDEIIEKLSIYYPSKPKWEESKIQIKNDVNEIKELTKK